jgi:hypothetical protein
VLFVALLVMVALSIAGVALMRSTDAATAVTGNLVLKQAASLAVDRGIERAVKPCGRRRRSSTARSTRRRRISTRASAAAQGGCMAANTDRAEDPDLLLGANGCSASGLASGLIANDDAGNRSCYVIERMCLAPGAAIRSNCNLATGALGADPGTEHYIGLIRPGDAYYRVTVRVEGPRNTVTYAQAILK